LLQILLNLHEKEIFLTNDFYVLLNLCRSKFGLDGEVRIEQIVNK